MNEGLRQVIESDSEMAVCGIAGNVQDALELVESEMPDMVITDLSMPGRNGLELIKDLAATHPELPVLVLSLHDELLYAERVLRAGGRGYVSKSTPTEILLKAIHCVLEGGIYTSPAVTSHFLQSLLPGKRPSKLSFPLDRLTDRELEVFELIGNGRGNQDIASELGISPRTVDVHRSNIREKLGLEDSSALTRYAIRWIAASITR